MKKRKIKIKIKKNKYKQNIDAELDLHGYTKMEAEAELIDFIEESKSRNYERVRVVTGRGVNSKDGIPVLKNFVEQWLSYGNYKFRHAKVSEGGEGAVIIKLR